MSIFKKLFGEKKKEEHIPENEFTQEQYDKDDELKEEGLQIVLGKVHNMVGHAIIPFDVGGAVDMYYFPNHIQGTGFATMELIDPNGNGPMPNEFGTYELVAFTKEPYNEDEQIQTAFNLIERRICGTFTTIGRYSSQAVLRPNQTCEIPTDNEENQYLIFDNYQPSSKTFRIGERKHHLLLCLEIFRSELEFARENGSPELLSLLKQKNIYPYSDLDRDPVA
jgi:hypothetical protein